MQPNAPGSQGYNLYAYVANNPTRWTDPSGHAFGIIPLALVDACLNTPSCAAPFEAGTEAAAAGGLIGIGGGEIIVFALVICALDFTAEVKTGQSLFHGCFGLASLYQNYMDQYGSAAAAGAWALGAQASRTAWHNLPQLPPGASCAVGAAENLAATAIQNAAGGDRGSGSDYSFAAAWGCVSGGGGGRGGDPLERHHLLPKQFENYFKRADLEIEEYTVDLSRSDHRLKPDGLHTGPDNWNSVWKKFIDDNPVPDKDRILQQLDKMMRSAGLK